MQLIHRTKRGPRSPSRLLPAAAALLVASLALVSGNSYGMISGGGVPLDPHDQVVLGPLIGKVKAPLGRGEGFSTGHPGLEAEFVSRINALRADQGLPALQVHDNLVSKARNWSLTMAEAGEIFHSHLPDEIVVPWRRLGENVGVGPTVPSLHDAFVASPHHYENLVDHGFDHIGIGITTTSDGTIYVSQMFMEVPATAPAQGSGGGGLQAPPSAPKPPSGAQPAPKPTTPKPATPKPPAPNAPAPTAAPPVAATPTTTAEATTPTTVASASPKLSTKPISRSHARHNLPVAAILGALGGLALVAGLLALRFARRFDPVSS